MFLFKMSHGSSINISNWCCNQCGNGFAHWLQYTRTHHTHIHSMQPDEYLNRSKPVVTIGLSCVVSLLLVLIWIFSDLCLFYSNIIVCTNILLFYFRLNLYWWILGRIVRHKAWFCFNDSFLCIFRLSSSGLFSFIFL